MDQSGNEIERQLALEPSSRPSESEGIGSVHFQVTAPKPSELPAMLTDMFRVEAANWKGKSGSALLNDSHRRQFYEQYAVTACEKGILRISFMRIGEGIVATQLAVESRGGFWLSKSWLRRDVCKVLSRQIFCSLKLSNTP